MSNELAHYGVKGMRWGVRKAEPRSQRSRRPLKDSEKSAHRIKTEARYLAKGETRSEAERLADRKIKTQKILLAVGAVTVTAAAAYVGTREFEKRFTGVDLAKGSVLKNVNVFGEKQNYDRRMYTTINEADGRKYRGLLAMQLELNGRRAKLDTTVYEASLKATERIKAPSHRQAEKLYKEFQQKNPHLKNRNYKIFNRDLVEDGPDQKPFFDFMKSKGYNSILDANDQFLSSYDTKKPLIIFNAKSSTVEAGRRVITGSESDKLYFQQVGAMAAKSMAPYVGLGMAAVAGKRALDTRTIHGRVNKHFMDHPKEKRSYAEVYNEYEKKRGDYLEEFA